MCKTNFKVGDEVTSPYHGEGIVVGIQPYDEDFPIIVKFNNHGFKQTYTLDGRYFTRNEPSLFHKQKTENPIFFEIGQTVYCSVYGQGVVTSVNVNPGPYYIEVCFNEEFKSKYTIDGRFYRDSEITLSQTPIALIVNTPIISFKKDEIVEVSDDGKDWAVAYFINKSEKGFKITGSKSSSHHYYYKFCRKPE